MLKNKKTLIIIVISLIIIALITIGIFFYFKKTTKPPTKEKAIEQILINAKFIKIKEREQKILYLDTESFLLKEFDIKMQISSTIYKTPIYTTTNLTWSPNGTKIIAKIENNTAILTQTGDFLDKNYGDEAVTTWVIDLTSDLVKELPLNIAGVDWLSEEKIIYNYNSVSEEGVPTGETSVLVTSSWDGTGYQEIYNFEQERIFNAEILLSPNRKKVIINSETEGYGENAFYLFDLENKKIQKISEDSLTPAAKWSMGGEYILFYKVNKYGEEPILWLANQNGVEKKNTKLLSPYGLAITSPDDKYIYAVVPKDNRIEFNDFDARTGDDLIYQINSGNLEKMIIFDASKHEEIGTITEIGLLGEDIFIVSNNNLYRIKT